MRIDIDLYSAIASDAPPLSSHVIFTARRQQAALPLEDGSTAIATSTHRILFNATGRRKGSDLDGCVSALVIAECNQPRDTKTALKLR